jgi:hypothetical protein
MQTRLITIVVIVIAVAVVCLGVWWFVQKEQCEPPIPTGLIASSSSDTITLSWKALVGVTGYKLYISTVSGINKASYGQKLDVSTNTTAVKLNPGTYYFRVSGVKVCNGMPAEGDLSSEVSAKTPCSVALLAAPSVVTAEAGDVGCVTIEWTSVTSASFYRVFRKEDTDPTADDYDDVVDVSSSTQVTFSGLGEGTVQNFAVSSVNTCGNVGPLSNVVQYTVGCISPNTADITAITTDVTELTMDWSEVDGADSYVVYLKAGPEVSKSTYDTRTAVPSGLTHTFTGLTAETEYAIGVTAVSDCGEGVLTYSTVTTDAAPMLSRPNIPSGSLGTSGKKVSLRKRGNAAPPNRKIAGAGLAMSRYRLGVGSIPHQKAGKE